MHTDLGRLAIITTKKSRFVVIKNSCVLHQESIVKNIRTDHIEVHNNNLHVL